MPDVDDRLLDEVVAAWRAFEDSIAFYLSDEAWDAVERMSAVVAAIEGLRRAG